MSNNSSSIDYGPLAGLIGLWKGDKGIDHAPEPDGAENTPFYETINFEAIGDVTNAESQTLAVLHYRQIVQRQSDDEVFHDETGYWMWDSKQNIVMHSLVIPRAVCILAGGHYQNSNTNHIILEVAASQISSEWQIIQSPFMEKNASTKEFKHKITIKGNTLSYTETTIVDIYGKTFDHTDSNELERV